MIEIRDYRKELFLYLYKMSSKLGPAFWIWEFKDGMPIQVGLSYAIVYICDYFCVCNDLPERWWLDNIGNPYKVYDEMEDFIFEIDLIVYTIRVRAYDGFGSGMTCQEYSCVVRCREDERMTIANAICSYHGMHHERLSCVIGKGDGIRYEDCDEVVVDCM